MIIFLAVLCCFLSLALHQGHLIRAGAALLVLSDAFIFFRLLTQEPWWIHVLSLGIYYTAMVLLALGTKDDVKLPSLSSRGLRRAQKHQLRKSSRHPQEEHNSQS